MPTVRDPAERLLDLTDTVEPRLQRRFVEAIFLAKSKLTLEVLIGYLEHGRVNEALLVVDRLIAGFANEVARSRNLSASQTAEKVISRAVEVFHFDETDPRYIDAARNAKLDLIRSFSDEQRKATRAAITDGIEHGLNPRDQARVIRDSIGLTEKQQQAVNNYRRLLEQGSREALDRELRDRRFDKTVERVVDGGEPLSKDAIDRMVSRYAERYVRYRSEVIARTEALRSVHEGNDAAYQQAFDSGELDPGDITREWETSLDERVRAIHETMHGQERGPGEPFEDGHGNLLMRPGDAEAPIESTAQCRCSLSTRIDIGDTSDVIIDVLPDTAA